jgi:hypothetical protein
MSSNLSQFRPAEILANEALSTTSVLSTGAAGEIPYAQGGGITAMLAAGSAGQFLQANGAAPPAWTTITVDANNLTGTTLSPSVVNSSLTSVGTLASLSVTGSVSAASFTGAGTGLTGTASSLNIGGSAALNLLLTGGTMTGAINMGAHQINNVADPSLSSDAATKAYVDSVAVGLAWKEPVQAASTADLGATYSGTPNYTLTANTNGAFTTDGYSANGGDRILVKDQATDTQNGIYVVTTVGTVSTPFVLTRASDFMTATEIDGAAVFVENGTLYAHTGWVQTSVISSLDTSPITFQQFSASSSGVTSVSAGTGITVNQTTGAVIVTNAGVLSLTGTTNQISVSSSTGAITLTLPQNINIGASPSFDGSNFSNIPNGALAHSSVTIGSTSIALGATATSITGLTSIAATTFTGALSGNASTASIATNVSGGAAGSLPYQTALSTTTMLALGTTNYILTAGASAPQWTNPATITVSASTNISGGTTGQVPYQSSANTTAFVTNGTGVLQASSSGATPAWTTTPTLTGTNFSGIPNGALSNSSITIGSSNVSLGGSISIITGLTSISATTFTGTLSGNATSATTATNIAGGTTGQVPYQSGAGATTYVVNGAGVLQATSSGATPAWTTAPTLTGTNFTSIPNGALSNSSITVSPGTGMSGGGTVSLGGTVTLTNAGVTSLAGTANEIAVSTSTGSVTLSLPQNVIIPAPSSGVGLTVHGVSGTHSTKIEDSATNSYNAGFLEVPQNAQSTSYATVLSDSGKHLYYSSSTGFTATITANATVAYPIGTTISFINTGTAALTIACGDTMNLAGAGTTGSRTLAQWGIATAIKVGTTQWIISGTNLT